MPVIAVIPTMCPVCHHPIANHHKTANLSKQCWTPIDNPHRNFCECSFDSDPAWTHNYEELLEIADENGYSGYALCSTCFVFVPQARMQAHYVYHARRGEI